MSFSPRQQPEFRRLVEAAWQAHCRAEATAADDKVARRAWYEEELEGATGKRTTKECGGGRDYEAAMAHFEELSGDGIEWQLRQHDGDARRIIFQIGQISAEHGVDHRYIQGVARQMLQRDELPSLHDLSPAILVNILGNLSRHVRRQKKATLTSGICS
jgi:hypothetical protein